MRVLLASANPGFVREVCRALREAAMLVKIVATAGEAVAQVRSVPYAVLILDLALPGARGWEFLRRMRRVQPATPILALVDGSGPEERVEALRLGANDCLAPPVVLAELQARVHALARRAARRAGECLELEDLVLHCDRRQALRAGQSLALTEREFVVLEHLLRAQGQPVPAAELLGLVWDEPTPPRENFIAVLVHRLRRKVDTGQVAKLVHSLRGQGYAVRAVPPGSVGARPDS